MAVSGGLHVEGLIKSYGDLNLGTKFAYPLAGGVSAGGELGVHFLSSVSGILRMCTALWPRR